MTWKTRKRKNQDGSYSYTFRHFLPETPDGKRPSITSTFRTAPGLTEAQADRQAQIQWNDFIKSSQNPTDKAQSYTFAQYAAYAMKAKKNAGVKYRTLDRYEDLLKRINIMIGDIPITDITPRVLTELYNRLRGDGVRIGRTRAIPLIDFSRYLSEKDITHTALAKKADVSTATISSLCKGNAVSRESAEKICAALSIERKVFRMEEDTRPLSDKTVLEYHQLISSILEQAEKEMLVPYNAASKVFYKPKAKSSHSQRHPDRAEMEKILDALGDETEPLKWRVIVHLMIVTGCRRGRRVAADNFAV